MTDKKASRKIETGGGAYIEGGVNTGGGDFVAGSQNKVSIGQVHNSTVATGNGNTLTVGAQGQGPASLADLVKLVAEMRAALPQAKLDEDTAEVVEGHFEVVERQLAKPEPKKGLVLPSLETVAKTLTATVAAGEAVTKLAPMVQQAITWAGQILK